MMKVQDATDKDIAAGTGKEMILVHPDANTIYNGSMYSNSPTNGDWEAYITEDLVSYIDSHYRTLADRNEPRSGGALHGRLRDHPHRHEVSGGFLQPVYHERLLLLNNPGAQGRGRGAQDKAKQPPGRRYRQGR